jgi:hypothetical protein
MLLILAITMKASGYSKQVKYDKITALLVAVQTYRTVGVVFLLGLTQGIFEPAFAIPAGVGDILVGVTAIPIAIFLWRGYNWSKSAVVIWSVLGITDLVYAVTLGTIIYPDFTTSPFGTFPWILVPTVAVPISIALHGIILYRIRKLKPTMEPTRYV